MLCCYVLLMHPQVEKCFNVLSILIKTALHGKIKANVSENVLEKIDLKKTHYDATPASMPIIRISFDANDLPLVFPRKLLSSGTGRLFMLSNFSPKRSWRSQISHGQWSHFHAAAEVQSRRRLFAPFHTCMRKKKNKNSKSSGVRNSDRILILTCERDPRLLWPTTSASQRRETGSASPVFHPFCQRALLTHSSSHWGSVVVLIDTMINPSRC